ncbi:MAG TPA: NAD(P)H-dependent oxidoreductase subunit E [Myxococcota bacterium]|nr:NAD(P)H-dependent oxidoreductase subunit E [Myxococcota bacterium]
MDTVKLESIIDRHKRDPAALLAILQDIQAEENYLPKEDIKTVAKKLDLPLSRVYSLATFFSSFSLQPRGKHICTVCLGTACHVRGASSLVDHIGRELDVRAGSTTADMQVTLETVNCVGACAMGPLLIMDDEYHGNMTVSKLDRLLKPFTKE